MTPELPIRPARGEFLARAAGANLIPLSIELIADGETPIGAFQKLLEEDAVARVRAADTPFCSSPPSRPRASAAIPSWACGRP